jgi:hypothetical protein
MGSRSKTELHLYERGRGSADWSEILCDADIDRTSGAFLVSGEAGSAAAYRVHLVTSGSRQVSSGCFEPGDRNFVIELGAPAELHTTLLVDDKDHRRNLKVRLDQGESLWVAPGTSRSVSFRETLRSLHPGGVDVELLHDSGAVFARRAGVELVSGETTEIEFDLRGRLLDVWVRLEYSEKEPASGGVRVLFRESDSGPYDLVAEGSGSRYRILTTASRVDVVVLAKWHAARWLDDVDADVTCSLERGPSVVVGDPDGVCKYNSAYSLSVTFHSLDPRIAAVTPSGHSGFPREDGGSISLPVAGQYRVEWIAKIGEERRTLAAQQVVVREGPQRLDLPIPLEALRQFRQEMNR